MSDRIPSSDYESSVLGWMCEALQEGDNFLRAQDGYSKIQQTLDALSSRPDSMKASYLSQTRSNHLSKISLDLTAALTDIRPFWEYRTGNDLYQRQAEAFNKLSLHWWLAGGLSRRGNDLRWADTVKSCVSSATGWSHQVWNPLIEDIDLQSEDPRDVIPIRPVSADTIQDALGVIVRRKRTVNYVRSLPMFEGKEHLIQPTSDGSAASYASQSRAGRVLEWIGSPFRDRLFNQRSSRDIPRIPTVDLYTAYIQDDSRNESGKPRYMGEWTREEDGSVKPVNNWSYIVQPGDKLYPRRRQITFTEQVIGKDGPSPYWHGLVPLSKLTLDNPAQTFLGKAPLWDLLPLQQTLDRLLRVLDDYFEKVARPDIIADKNAISKSFLDRLDTRRAGGKFSVNPMAGKGGFQLVYPQFQGVDMVMKMLEYITNEMDTLSGVRDLSQLMRLNQLPQADTIEKMMESMTASVRLRSRVIESFMREFATMLMYNFAQFYTVATRLAIAGADGVTVEDYDWDPGTLIPWNPEIPRMDAARDFLRQFTYHIAPGSLLSASAMEKKLMYLQLWRGGALDTRTLLETLDVPRIDQIMSRLAEQQQAMAQMAAGPNASPAGGIAGRKATAQVPPHFEVKSGGRSTVAES